MRFGAVDTVCPSCMFIWSSFTKYRYRVSDGDAANRLRAIFSKVSINFGAELVEMDGQDNHVHLLVGYPPKHSISALVNSLKGVSSRMLRLERPTIAPLLEGRALVAVLLCCRLWRCSNRHSQSVPRTAKNTALAVTGAYIPALKGEVLRPHG